MRRLDGLITQAELVCTRAPAEPRAQKLSTCRRALACIEPAKKAQHAVQAMLLTMAKMEDSADDRLTASAASAGAVAACGVAGFAERLAKGANDAKPVAPTAAPQNAASAIVDRVEVRSAQPTPPQPAAP